MLGIDVRFMHLLESGLQKDEEQPAEEKPEDGSAEAEDEEEEMEEEDEDEDGKKKRKKKSKVESAEKETGKEIAEEELEEEIDELKGQAMDVAANKAGVDKSSAEEVGDGAGLSPEDLDMSAFLGDETKQTISEFLINAAGKLCFFFCETECGEVSAHSLLRWKPSGNASGP